MTVYVSEVEMLQMATKIKLADARAELRVSQDALSKAAKVSKQALVNAEKGLTIQRLTAWAILNALNAIRRDYGHEPLAIHDIDWNIKGDGD